LWQVTVISPVEIHSGKPDNEGVNGHYGFGCGERGPVRDWRLGRGFFVAHRYIIRTPPTNCKRKVLEIRTGGTYTWVMPRKKLPPEVLEYFVRMGKKGGASGGRARAAKMTAEARSASAKKAVEARWARAKRDQDDA
jgi:hypothetical protein